MNWMAWTAPTGIFCGHSIGFVFFGCAGVEKADGIDERMVAHGNNPR